MKYLLIIGSFFISACTIPVSKAIDKHTKAKFLIDAYLSDSLKVSLDARNALQFSKLDTNRSLSVMQFYMPGMKNEYWISCTYKEKGIARKVLFAIDTAISKVDTAIQKDQ